MVAIVYMCIWRSSLRSVPERWPVPRPCLGALTAEPPERSRSDGPTSQLSTGLYGCGARGSSQQVSRTATRPRSGEALDDLLRVRFRGRCSEIWGDVGRHILSGLRVYTRNGVTFTVRSRDTLHHTPYRLRTTYARARQAKKIKRERNERKGDGLRWAYDYARTPRQENIHQISLGGRALV